MNEVAKNENNEGDSGLLALAHRIEAVRRAKNLSLDEVAARSGVSRATLSRIERAETSPTAHVLGKLCAVYGLTMSQLLLAVEEDEPRLIRFAEAFSWRDPESGFERTSISPPARGYEVEVMHGALPAGGDIAYDRPPIAGLEQHVVMLEGELLLDLDTKSFTLRPQDCLRLKLLGASRFRNLSRRTARYLIINRRPS